MRLGNLSPALRLFLKDGGDMLWTEGPGELMMTSILVKDLFNPLDEGFARLCFWRGKWFKCSIHKHIGGLSSLSFFFGMSFFLLFVFKRVSPSVHPVHEPVVLCAKNSPELRFFLLEERLGVSSPRCVVRQAVEV